MNWRLVDLAVGRFGGWLNWRLVDLAVGLFGGWFNWRLVDLAVWRISTLRAERAPEVRVRVRVVEIRNV